MFVYDLSGFGFESSCSLCQMIVGTYKMHIDETKNKSRFYNYYFDGLIKAK